MTTAPRLTRWSIHARWFSGVVSAAPPCPWKKITRRFGCPTGRKSHTPSAPLTSGPSTDGFAEDLAPPPPPPLQPLSTRSAASTTAVHAALTSSALVFGCRRSKRLLPADVDEHRADLADRDRDLEADLADRLGLACGRAALAQLDQELLEPFDLRVVLLLRVVIRHRPETWSARPSVRSARPSVRPARPPRRAARSAVRATRTARPRRS